MLEQIRIRDFAVARSVDLDVGPGLTVFTGETGAGKSLVVDALAFVFGARRGREVIAAGADQATVEVVALVNGDRHTIGRTVSLAGRSSARVDGRTAAIEELQQLGAAAIDIHGQSDQVAILKPAAQLRALDAFAGLDAERDAFAVLVRRLRELRRKIRAFSTDARERERLVDQLCFEVEEIESAAITPGEDAELQAERTRLASVRKLLAAATMALEALDSPAIAEASASVTTIVGLDPAATILVDHGGALSAAAEELARELRRYRDGLEEDPERLGAVEERLDRLARLRRKYGETLDDVVAYGRDAAARLRALTGESASIDALAAEEAGLVEQCAMAAAALSLARRSSAGDLVRRIAMELQDLGLGAASLSVGFSCEDDPDGLPVALPDYESIITEREAGAATDSHLRAFTEAGVDRVEFLASFNTGETPRPLAAVASGGETSRFLLALTTVLGAAAEPRTIVFDEVDEGVGGRSGSLVGAALARLAVRHQVLCITHLAQVAAAGTTHQVVTKQVRDGRTESTVSAAVGDARVEELAAMLGTGGEAARAAARELLAASRG